MAASRVVLLEVCAAIRTLLARVPPYGATVQQWADYHMYKAEVFDLIAATDLCLYAHVGMLADRARRQAHRLVYGEHGDNGNE